MKSSNRMSGKSINGNHSKIIQIEIKLLVSPCRVEQPVITSSGDNIMCIIYQHLVNCKFSKGCGSFSLVTKRMHILYDLML